MRSRRSGVIPPGASALMSGSMNCADRPTPPRIDSLWNVVSASSHGCVVVCPVLRSEKRRPADNAALRAAPGHLAPAARGQR